MQEELQASLVRIRTNDGQVVGAGFLVGKRYVLTCAHVVAAALGLADDTPKKPQIAVCLDVPQVTPGLLISARVVLWRPLRVDSGDDIAGLELDNDPPPGALAAPLAQINDLWEHSFQAFGFPRGQDTGVWATGRLLGRQTNNWVQIADVQESAFSLEPGFSGTPVWDTQVEAVVGMVVASEKSTNLKSAFVVPVDVLVRNWPLLESLIHPFVFLCYARADNELVTRLKTDLLQRGVHVWIDLDGIQPGTLDWEEVLRTAIRAAKAVLLIASPNARTSRYVRDELRISEMYQRPVYPLWIAGTQWIDAVPLGWGATQYVDARESRYETALSALVEIFTRTSSTSPKAPMLDFEARNPYKSLRAFTSNDTQDFFGRDTLVNELAARLEGALASESKNDQCARLLAVIGPSGSGKSSVVMAGLLPRLREGRLPGSKQWVYLDPIVPGTRPVEALSLALSELMPDKSLKVIREDLDDDALRGLHLLATKLAKQPGTKVVLLVDQFEELFTQTSSEDERRRFIDLVVTATTEPRGPFILLLTLRADFYDRPMRYPLLHQLIQDHQSSVLPMAIHDLREVIEKPAALPDVSLSFEGDLVGDLLFEVQNQVGALPLLQFTLDQLFQRRNARLLTLSAYRELGGVKGALTRQAEETYSALPSDEHRKLARALFVRLIEPGATEQDTTRRRAALSEFSLPETSKARMLQEVADTFIAVRLLTTNEIAGTTTIEVSHEALIREWPRLATWLREAREDIRLQQTISEDTAEWQRRKKPGDRLYRGSQLKEAQAWAKRNMPSGNEVAFLRAATVQRIRFIASVTAIVLLLLSTTGIAGWLFSHLSPDPTHVSNLRDDNNPGSLRYAITASPAKSTITFDPGLHGKIMLSSGDLNIAQDLTIRGPGADSIAISGGKSGHIVRIVPGITVTISGLAFKDSKTSKNIAPSNGFGFIYNEYGSLTLDKCTISNNSVSGSSIVSNISSGIYSTGPLSLTNSTISGNSVNTIGASTRYGIGGIYSTGPLILTNSIISGNSVGTKGTTSFSYGIGGIYSIGSLILNNSIISGNSVNHINGVGGINSQSLTLNNSTVSGNSVNFSSATSYSYGTGGIYSQSPTLNNSTVSGNSVNFSSATTAKANIGSFSYGIGGINSTGSLILTNSTVSGNSGSGKGIGTGGIYNRYGLLTLTNSTVSGNAGGGIFIRSMVEISGYQKPVTSIVKADITFSTIYDNTVHGGSNIAIKDTAYYYAGNTESTKAIKQISQVKISSSIVAPDPTHPGPDITGTLTSYGYNLFQGNSGATFDPSTKKQHSTDKLLSASDLTTVFANPAKQQNNGGTTQTYALAAGSPAIDAIPLRYCQLKAIYNSRSHTYTDQRSTKRPDNGEDRCDIGAYEYVDAH